MATTIKRGRAMRGARALVVALTFWLLVAAGASGCATEAKPRPPRPPENTDWSDDGYILRAGVSMDSVDTTRRYA